MAWLVKNGGWELRINNDRNENGRKEERNDKRTANATKLTMRPIFLGHERKHKDKDGENWLVQVKEKEK